MNEKKEGKKGRRKEGRKVKTGRDLETLFQPILLRWEKRKLKGTQWGCPAAETEPDLWPLLGCTTAYRLLFLPWNLEHFIHSFIEYSLSLDYVLGLSDIAVDMPGRTTTSVELASSLAP